VRFDGGKEFLAEAVRRAAGERRCAALPTAPYSPHLKGKVERLNHGIVVQHPRRSPRDAQKSMLDNDAYVHH
jgi:transposase InsO family protein